MRWKRDESGQDAIAGAIAVVLVVVAVFVLVWLVMFMRGWKSVPPDKVLLHYTGGPVQGTHFKEVVAPGSHTKFYGLLENYYYLPSTQRTYIITADPKRGDRGGVDVVSAPSKDSVPMQFEAAVYFKLNTKPDVIRQFMEQICLHDHCNDLAPGAGWDQMLDQYFRPQIDQALRIEAGKYNFQDEWHDPQVRLTIQQAIGPVLNERINQAIGGQFFCGPDSTPTNCTDFGFVLQGATPPANVVAAYAATAEAQQNVQKAQQEAAAKVAAADGDRDAQNARAQAAPLSEAQIDYLRAQAMDDCAKNSNCTLIVDGSSAGVNVNAGGAKAK